MVFGLFSKERAFQRTVKKATDKLAQQPERWAAMEKLRDDGSEEALFHLLKRFSFASQKMVEDEQEKSWVVETMAAKGSACLPALRRYMKAESAIAYPLRILEKVASHDQALEIIDELLADEQPGYTRDTTKRIQIIDWLAEWQEGTVDEAAERITPYLQDFDEGVRFAAVEALSLRPSPKAAEPLVTALLRDGEESRRLKVRIAEILCDAQLDLGGKKQEISALFGDVLSGYRLHHDKLARTET